MIVCPSCGHKFAKSAFSRTCFKCRKPILRGHKWQVDGSRIRHRICSDPTNYPKGT